MNALPAGAPPGDATARGVDPQEAAFYERLASTWWDRAGPFWPLHRLNALRTAYLRDVLARAFGRDPAAARPLDALAVVDVGCGGGILSESIAALGANVHGIDVVARNLEVARRHALAGALDVRYEYVTAAALAARGAQYDIVLNMEVIEHVPDVPAYMADCARLVRPGGVMALATINRTALSWLFAIVGAEYVLRWLPRGTHRWDRFVTPGEACALLERNGLAVFARSGVYVNPLNRHFALSRLMAVNYMLVARRERPVIDFDAGPDADEVFGLIDAMPRTSTTPRDHPESSTMSAPLTVYYDGACPLCRREIDFYRHRRGAERVAWVDVSAAQADTVAPGLCRADALARFHVRTGDGRLVSGARAFAALWAGLPEFRWLGRIAGTRLALPVLEAAYRRFLRWRPAMQRLAARRAAS